MQAVDMLNILLMDNENTKPIGLYKNLLDKIKETPFDYEIKNQCEKLLEKYPDINIENKEGEINISFDGDKIEIKELMRNLLDCGSIQDLNIKENDLTNVVKTIYENKNF